ncbi:MAG: hypothetical protein JWN78_2017 [Bacteroidota bacterium]|nr:hypothetical protein [Bacteroidota bacterium]
MFVSEKNDTLGVKAYQGDAKTLLAFDLNKTNLDKFAGFTIACKPGSTSAYYLYNKLQFANPEDHAQNKNEPAYSSINAPIQKFRWLHVPGAFHQGDSVFFGRYTYTITPRYFDENNKLDIIDPKLGVDIMIDVKPFVKGKLSLGFTRGFVQSQAFESHFGKKAILRPAKNKDLVFDTNLIAGKNNDGDEYSFKDEFTWSGFTAREQIFSILKEVSKTKGLSLDVFAYDLNEPDIVQALLSLAKQGRVRVLLDNATLHHSTSTPKPEDLFEKEFNKVAKKPAQIQRGKFTRFQHNKVCIVKSKDKAIKVLMGSTNFSITGIYVNSNHVFVFDNAKVAGIYSDIFNEAWQDKMNSNKFKSSDVADKVYPFNGGGLPDMRITFAPHNEPFANTTLNALVARVKQEKSSVIFAVMELDKSGGPVVPALKALHKNNKVFSMGISDSTTDLFLYKPNSKTGIKVTGKSSKVLLPPPFNEEASIGLGHQIHHKFIVCGFNTPDAVVWGGSSNLALLGEQQNGDNLLEIHDTDIATVFALEGMALVDHFHFRNANMEKAKTSKVKKSLTLYENNKWALSYYNPKDLHFVDRMLFK